MKRTFVLLVCMLACSLAGFAQNLITNGSFELPVVPVSGFTAFNIGDTTSIPGWAVVGNAGMNVFIGSTTLCDSGPPKTCYPAQHGQQFLDLTGAGSNGVEGVEAMTGTVTGIPTTIGAYYQLSYWVGNVSLASPYGPTSTVQVYVNNTLLTADTNSMSTPLSGGIYYMGWQQFIHVFQATTANTRIKFMNGDPSTDGINGLDNVVLLQFCSCRAVHLPTNVEAGDSGCGDPKVATKSEQSGPVAHKSAP